VSQLLLFRSGGETIARRSLSAIGYWCLGIGESMGEVQIHEFNSGLGGGGGDSECNISHVASKGLGVTSAYLDSVDRSFGVFGASSKC
jgi:hypothetical protein